MKKGKRWHVALAAMCFTPKCGYFKKGEGLKFFTTEREAHDSMAGKCPNCKKELEVWGIEIMRAEEIQEAPKP